MVNNHGGFSIKISEYNGEQQQHTTNHHHHILIEFNNEGFIDVCPGTLEDNLLSELSTRVIYAGRKLNGKKRYHRKPSLTRPTELVIGERGTVLTFTNTTVWRYMEECIDCGIARRLLGTNNPDVGCFVVFQFSVEMHDDGY
jgi:hypothetical protein